MSIEDKVERVEDKATMQIRLEEMEPQFTDKAFDFYGVYTRISEPQKFRYAESKVINHYKKLI